MRVFKYFRLGGKLMVGLVVFTMLSALAQMFTPTLLGGMIDGGVKAHDSGVFMTLGIAMIVLAIIQYATAIGAARLSSHLATSACATLREKLFVKVQSFSAAETDKFGTASLVARSTSDVTQIQTFLIFLLQFGVMAPLVLVTGLVLASVSGGELSTVLTIAIPILLVIVGVIVVILSRLSKTLRVKIDIVNRLFLETLTGVRPIRAFNRQKNEMDRFNVANESNAQTAIAQGRLMALLMPAIMLIFGLTTTAVLAYGSYLVGEGTIEVGALVANVQYVQMILMAIIMMSALIMFYPTFSACASRVVEVLETEVSVKDGRRSLSDRTSKGTIVFDNVSFSYPGAREAALQELSFTAVPGTTTAIIGPTGCGKSSVLKLIERLYDVTIGSVTVDGIDVRDYKLDDLRSLIGYVPQKNVLFSGDIASNLAWGDEQGDEEAWKRACRIACASEFVEGKDGVYHASVSQGGSNFSGGQRQRLAIARALMRDAEVFLFDDSFSALDMKTDRELRGNIHRELSDATIFIVAQRVGTIIDADQIIVLDQGCVVGLGTHSELLRSCDLYRELATLQLGEEAVAAELAEGSATLGNEDAKEVAANVR